MSDISFIIPSAPFLLNTRAFPNLGVLYLTTVLKQARYSVQVIDLLGGEALPEVSSGIVGITMTSPTFPEGARLLKEVKARDPGSWVVAGGPHATVSPKDCLDAGFDQVVVGEGERAILKVVQGNKDRIIQEPYIQNLDSIPFPDRSAVDMSRYSYESLGVRATHMITSRGCPWACSFCCRMWDHPPRYRGARNVIAESGLLYDQGYRGISLFDDEMLVQWSRDQEIFRNWQAQGFTYRLLTRANLISPERARFLAETGCQEVFIGIESGSDRILINIDKKTSRVMNLKAIKALHDAGIRVKAGFVIGLPGEDEQSIRDTETFIEESRPDDVDFSLLTVMAGSPIADNPGAYDLKWEKTYEAYKGTPGKYVPTIATSKLNSKELLAARDRLEHRFKQAALLR